MSVVVPVHDERDNLDLLHRHVREALDGVVGNWELILVNDGSTDGSDQVLDRLAVSDPRVRALHLASRRGQTAALLAGFRAARGDAICMMDADLQNDPADLPRLLAALDDHGAVVGWRRNRQDTWVRRVSSRIANAVRNALTRETITDTGCSLKVFRREAIEHLWLTRGMHRFLPTLVRMQGFSVIELPVHHRPRHAGVSKYGIGNRLFVGIADLLMVAWMRRRAFVYSIERESGLGLASSPARDDLTRPGGN
ncbi:MAG: glycosyltransferase family 2 protein [Acidobacteriota bacterium]